MRILIVVDALNIGGAERQALYSARELARLGCDAELMHYLPIQDGYAIPNMDGARVTELPRRFGRLGRIGGLYRHIVQKRYDIVQGFKGVASIYAGVAGLLARRPLVFGSYRHSPYNSTGLARLCHRKLTPHLAGWIVNSKSIQRTMSTAISAPPEKFTVVYNGLEPDAFRSRLTSQEARARLGLRIDQPVVSIIAAMRPQKNHRLFFEAASCLLQTHPQTQFLVVGDGPLRSELEAYVTNLGIDSSVRFLGTRRDVGDILTATDVSVLTSYFEGVSNALIESMCAGVPVVSTDYDGVDELLTSGEQGYVVAQEASAVASRVATLIDDSPLRKRLGSNGRHMVEARFSLPVLGRNLLAVYENALQNREHRVR